MWYANLTQPCGMNMKSTLYLDLWLPQSAQQIVITLADMSIAASSEQFLLQRSLTSVRLGEKFLNIHY
jgi:hypothetical protein